MLYLSDSVKEFIAILEKEGNAYSYSIPGSVLEDEVYFAVVKASICVMNENLSDEDKKIILLTPEDAVMLGQCLKSEEKPKVDDKIFNPLYASIISGDIDSLRKYKMELNAASDGTSDKYNVMVNLAEELLNSHFVFDAN